MQADCGLRIYFWLFLCDAAEVTLGLPHAFPIRQTEMCRNQQIYFQTMEAHRAASWTGNLGHRAGTRSARSQTLAPKLPVLIWVSATPRSKLQCSTVS